jgi:hypothetical protein
MQATPRKAFYWGYIQGSGGRDIGTCVESRLGITTRERGENTRYFVFFCR